MAAARAEQRLGAGDKILLLETEGGGARSGSPKRETGKCNDSNIAFARVWVGGWVGVYVRGRFCFPVTTHACNTLSRHCPSQRPQADLTRS